MIRILAKILISSLLITCISEAGKRFTLVAAILASLPITSILAMIWLYTDTGDVQKISALSWGILWAVLPSLLFFIVLPILLKNGLKFYPALLISCVAMFLAYSLYAAGMKKLGVDF